MSLPLDDCTCPTLWNPYRNTVGRELWHGYHNDQTEGPDDQKVWSSARAGRTHHRAVAVGIRSGNLYLYCLNYDDHTSRWHFLSDLCPAWQKNTYTLLRFWLHTPKGLERREDGGFNFHCGTYCRAPDEETAHESDNNHWYYYGNLFPGTWNQVEIDLNHPHHQRNAPTQEWGLVESVYQGHLMADSVTSFYLDVKKVHGGKNLRWYPAQYTLDGVELDTLPLMSAAETVYSPIVAREAQKLSLSWSGRRDRLDARYTVRWASESIRTIGWDRANRFATGEDIPGTGDAGYNGITRTFSATFPHGPFYVGILTHGSPAFREIKVDVPG